MRAEDNIEDEQVCHNQIKNGACNNIILIQAWVLFVCRVHKDMNEGFEASNQSVDLSCMSNLDFVDNSAFDPEDMHLPVRQQVSEFTPPSLIPLQKSCSDRTHLVDRTAAMEACIPQSLLDTVHCIIQYLLVNIYFICTAGLLHRCQIPALDTAVAMVLDMM